MRTNWVCLNYLCKICRSRDPVPMRTTHFRQKSSRKGLKSGHSNLSHKFTLLSIYSCYYGRELVPLNCAVPLTCTVCVICPCDQINSLTSVPACAGLDFARVRFWPQPPLERLFWSPFVLASHAVVFRGVVLPSSRRVIRLP